MIGGMIFDAIQSLPEAVVSMKDGFVLVRQPRELRNLGAADDAS